MHDAATTTESVEPAGVAAINFLSAAAAWALAMLVCLGVVIVPIIRDTADKPCLVSQAGDASHVTVMTVITQSAKFDAEKPALMRDVG